MQLNIDQTLKNLAAAACSALLALSVLPSLQAAGDQTALDRYIAQPDSHYSYKLLKSHKADGLTAHVLEMTSQKWLTEKEVDKPIWKHWVTIIQPGDVSSDTGLLFIGGGSNDKPAPDKLDDNLLKVAAATRSVVTELRMVPNQPLVFHGDGKKRFEDDLIAYTWDQYLRTGDERWPARLPMTKSALRAMDTVTAFCASDEGGKVAVKKFVVAGGSKRGWTTWAAAAVDKRIIAIAPMVIDLLNVVPSFKHHYAAYGFWAPAVGDYERHGIMNWVDTPEYAALMKIEDPYEYRDRLTMPKFMINSAGDQFFLPDSAQFYWKDLKGQNFIRYLPNSDHSLKNTDALTSLIAFYDAIIHHEKLPQFTWELPEPGVIRVESKTRPLRVRLWQATNPDARDFRLETLGRAYKDSAVEPVSEGVYEVRLKSPEKGWTAAFLEMTYDNKPAPFIFTSGVTVIPNTLPHAGKFSPVSPKTSQ